MMMPQKDRESICAATFIPWEKLRDQVILITGATGLIGTSLVNALSCVDEEKQLGF